MQNVFDYIYIYIYIGEFQLTQLVKSLIVV